MNKCIVKMQGCHLLVQQHGSHCISSRYCTIVFGPLSSLFEDLHELRTKYFILLTVNSNANLSTIQLCVTVHPLSQFNESSHTHLLRPRLKCGFTIWTTSSDFFSGTPGIAALTLFNTSTHCQNINMNG